MCFAAVFGADQELFLKAPFVAGVEAVEESQFLHKNIMFLSNACDLRRNRTFNSSIKI
jgi:hypothetical protein